MSIKVKITGIFTGLFLQIFALCAVEICIVVDSTAIPVEQTAARELQSLLAEATGDAIPICGEALPDKQAIYVGQSEKAAKALEITDWKSLRPDEIILKKVNDNLYLTGARPRGSLYAVYEFLEQQGFRFWTPDATRIPHLDSWEPPYVDYRYAPPIEVRSAGYEKILNTPQFAARCRINGHGVNSTPEWGGDVQILGGVHTMSENMGLLPVAEYFDRYPEWYSERNGARTRQYPQMCLTNQEMRKELTLKALERLRQYPDTKYVSVSQNDGANYCQCETCTRFVSEHGEQSDLLIDTVNEVAAEVAKEFPGVYVETLGYGHTRIPPRTVKPLDNVVIRYCTASQAFLPVDAPANQDDHDALCAWRKMARKMMIWHYATNFGKYYLPHPNWRSFASDIRLFRDCRAINVYIQGAWEGGGSAADLSDLRGWVISKLLWNPDLDQTALMEEFLNGFYGNAAGYVKIYINAMNQSADRHPEFKSTWNMRSTADWLDEDILISTWLKMREGVEQFASDPVYGPRMAMAAVPLGCALVERTDIFRRSELAGVSPVELIKEYQELLNSASVKRLREWGLSPDEWADWLLRTYGIDNGAVPNDGELPSGLAGASQWHAWKLNKVAELHALGRELFVEPDPMATAGTAVRMINTNSQWHLQSFLLPRGKYTVYVEVRCDSSNPQGSAGSVGIYDWRHSNSPISTDLDAKKLNGKAYQLIKLGELKIEDEMGFYAAPQENSSAENLWLDRIIFIGSDSGKP